MTTNLDWELIRLNHKETEDLNRPLMIKEIELVIRSLPSKEIPEPDSKSEMLPYLFYKVGITITL